jgi:1-acyl-sn-glycerol-3-phosphate acyltransferase
MLKTLANHFFRTNGWTLHPEVPAEAYQRCVMIAAPHTSQWDFFYTMAAFDQMKIPLRFAIKQEFRLPLIGGMMDQLGALWIDRSGDAKQGQRPSYIELMAEVFAQHEQMVMLIAAEGSRSLRPQWRSGFYHVARQAGVPIALGYLDYSKKEAGVGPAIYPTDDQAADMKRIMAFYRNIKGRHPEQFSLDQRYVP